MLALDPMLEGGLLWTPLLIVLLKVVVVFVIGLVATMLMVWFERKVIAGMQNRIGPNKAGPFGLLQTLADGIKLFFKEDLIPRRSDRFVFALAPLARDAVIHLHSSDALRLGVREGSDLRVAANGSAVVLPLVIDDAVSRGVAFVPFNQHGNDIRVLIRHDVPVTDLVIEVI